MKRINKIFVGLNRRQVLPGYFPMLHFRQDHHQIHHHEVDRGCHLLLLHHRHLRYGKERVNVMEWAVLQVMLRQWSFTVLTTIIRAEGFKVTSPLTLETYTTPHIRRKDSVNE
jgi:hypothetical protein